MDAWLFLVMAAAPLVILVAVFSVVLKVSLRSVPDEQRVALYRAGSFQGLRGPGRTLAIPFLDKAIPLAIGDEGTALTESRAQFQGADVPVRSSQHLQAGERVRIIGFDGEKAAVVLKTDTSD